MDDKNCDAISAKIRRLEAENAALKAELAELKQHYADICDENDKFAFRVENQSRELAALRQQFDKLNHECDGYMEDNKRLADELAEAKNLAEAWQNVIQLAAKNQASLRSSAEPVAEVKANIEINQGGEWTALDVSLPIGTKLYTAPHAPSSDDAIEEIITLYEQALQASWPEGAMGDAFDYWNQARIKRDAIAKETK